MAIGPGKYDAVCRLVRNETGGDVVVIVIGGRLGNGFSCQASLATTLALPGLLEEMARQIRKDGFT